MFFVVYPSQAPFELWSSDGTASGTRRVAVLPGTATDHHIRLLAARDHVFVGWHQNLWSSDGTPAGTQRLPVTPAYDYPLVSFGAGVLFGAWDSGSGRETLWSSDGSVAGTIPIRGEYDRGRLGWSEVLTDGVRHALFLADDVATGEAGIWMTDGTSAGTRRLPDLSPWVSSYGGGSAALGGLLIVAAEDPLLGGEPHLIDLGGTVQKLSAGCGGRGREATLHAVVGGSPRGGLELRGHSSAGSVALVLLSAPPRVPTALPAAGRCWLDVDPNSVAELAVLPVVGGSFARAFPLPDDPALYGLQAVVQALVGPTDAPLGFDLTNGVLLTLGR